MTDPERERDTDPAPPIRNDLTLGERCVEWCIRQLESEPRPSTKTLAAWFSIATRGSSPLVLKVTDSNRPNHCAIAQCNAAFQCKISGELIPHGMRASAKELMADAIKNGAWHSRKEIEQGWRPRTGDLTIYDRSDPKNPDSSWWGHVDRVIELVGPDAYANVGANETGNGSWKIDRIVRFMDPKVRILGCISYPTLEPVQRETMLEISDEDRAHVQSLNAMGLFEAEAKSWEYYKGRPG